MSKSSATNQDINLSIEGQDEGVRVGRQPALNFIGVDVTVTDGNTLTIAMNASGVFTVA